MRIIFSDEKMMGDVIACLEVGGSKALTVGVPMAPKYQIDSLSKKPFLLNIGAKRNATWSR